MSARSRAAATAVVTALASPLLLVAAAPAATPPREPHTATSRAAADDPPVAETESSGDEASLVAQEDDRISQVSMADALARVSLRPFARPYRLRTGPRPTLVLTARRAPYTWTAVRRLAGADLTQVTPDSVRLDVNLVVLEGATLSLTGDRVRTLQLASGPGGFVSLVNLGGRLRLGGTQAAPLRVTSWDSDGGGPDTDASDGRAYVRSLGGDLTVTDTALSDLGFWSGRTGGLAVTGSVRPGRTQETGAETSTETGTEAGDGGGAGATRDAVIEELVSSGRVDAATAYDSHTPGVATASLLRTSVTGSTFGFFASSLEGLRVSRSRFVENDADGLVLHRYVTGARIDTTTAADNGVDGLVLDRHVEDVRVEDLTSRGNGHDGIALAPAATDVVLTRVQSVGNVRNGVTMSGLPLAEGPSANGESSRTNGDNVVATSRVAGNGRYGLELIGGSGLTLRSSLVEGQQMGVVVREQARDVALVGNTVLGATAQGISVREGSTGVRVAGNTVEAGEISVYLRNSTARVTDNVLTGATNHAVVALGQVGASRISENRVSGRGPSAVDTTRVVDTGLLLTANDTVRWDDTTPWEVLVRRVLQPLTVVWILIVLVLSLTAVRHRHLRGVRTHPYADKAPLQGRQLDRGQVGPEREPERVA